MAVDEAPCMGEGCAGSPPGAGGALGGGGRSSAGAGGGGVTGSGGVGITDAGQGGGSGGTLGTGSDAGPGGSGGTLPAYTLVVEAPADGATVSGVVTVSGQAPGFVNVEVWDATHQHPPLARTTPAPDGTFSVDVDTTGLAAGPTTWTVWAWDTPAGEPFTRSATAPLYVTIGSGTDAGPRETVGVGDVATPALGPAPTDATKIGGAAFTLVKNWNFGTDGTIRDVNDLIAEFDFHDQFGTIANGTKYGAVIVAPTAATAIAAPGLGLPNDQQPVEDPASPNRQWTATSLLAHVRPLTATQTSVTASAHDAGNGSLVAKWKLPNGGALLGKDLLWETRVRMPKPVAGYWYAIWSSGNQWNGGAEVDVLESFGSANVYPPATAFLAGCVGCTSDVDYTSWPSGLTSAGVPAGARDLTAYHTWSWLYRKDDTFAIYYDGITVQSGTIHWTLGGAGGAAAQAIDLDFLFDFSFGHTVVQSVNLSVPASEFPLTYEVDYSRVYLR